MTNLWIEGGSRSGKTEYMIQKFCDWAEANFAQQANPQAASQKVLVLAVDSQQRQNLSDRLIRATRGQYPVMAATPLSFFRDEVRLFWTLLVKNLNFKSQFPLLLRVENEQELAAQVWKGRLDMGTLQMEGIGRDRLVRRLLDLFLLGANGGHDLREIPKILNAGIETNLIETTEILDQWQEIGEALHEWRRYCWERGLLTYGIIADLFIHHLLTNPQYQRQLKQRFTYVMIDRADEMPAIACDLCKFLLKYKAQGIFTFNPHGSARLGLGADPEYWQEIKSDCEVVKLSPAQDTLGTEISESVLTIINEPILQFIEPYAVVHSIESVSRAKLFRNVAETIAEAIASGEVKASDIAIIAPGLDNIAKYAIAEILRKKEINILPLNEQRPLSYSAHVRSLLTLITLVYPNLGKLVSRDHIAEMLVVLTEAIDPVRAGMIADYCFAPHPETPYLLAAETYNQWNRLGYAATQAYEQLRQWIEQQSPKDAPLLFIDRAIQAFLKPRKLNYEHMASLQSLIETAQYYWQLGYRLDQEDSLILENFIQLIRQGTVTANPYSPNPPDNCVVLATIFQYRMARLSHRWQFWLDASSELWLQGGAASLFGAPLFLKGWNGEKWTVEHQNQADIQRLQRLIKDLLDRVGDRLYLCHSELSTNGQIQNGALTPLIEISTTV
ncbi:MAG: hypothetical protein ACK5LW_18245 [Pseudanabaena sp.]|jgi:hypothetical protein|uniref:hypothetical protein n=1 Tax=Pseudanabaena mucicola TaxID=71190 RepID=UPI00257657CD|nr:hypothetical protein [Pseudanabaena mucicola]MCA6574591.1 hypothetical protein [Pseudanabaena sp. M53BS1SP1A06MG]MCA6584468.1 hypothetical protein [Pseudanabaena sp. M34BS1SP1A06MG]MCA6592294.1 hypothetical protein [Pseudanabaena sp. M38BS1SP1A06MG]MCA6599475.1 hypothetical protein [Pseudanabaena sp. M57BS1SP1A06MG]